MTQAAARRRWWSPRLNLATLLVLVAVVGGSMGWYAYSARVQRQTVRALLDAGATVIYDWEWDPNNTWVQRDDKGLVGWRRIVADRLGPDAVASVAAVSLMRAEGRRNTWGDEHIELIGRLKSLQGLYLEALKVTEEGAAPIAGLKCLRNLEIFGEPGPILAQLGEGSRLKRLRFFNARFDDDDIAAISRLAHLEHLEMDFAFGYEGIGDADLEKLSGLARLKYLHLPRSRITSEGLKPIARMKSLESITIFKSSIEDLTPILQLPALRRFDLRHSPIGDEALSILGRMPGLKSVSLASNSLTDAGVANLHNLPGLVTLLLQSDCITAVGLESLADIKSIKYIYIIDTKIAAERINEFAKSHPGIILRSL